MAWMPWMMLAFLTIQKIIQFEAAPSVFDPTSGVQKDFITEVDNIDRLYKSIEPTGDKELQRLGHQLTEILLHPDETMPLVYVDEYPNNAYFDQLSNFRKSSGSDLTDIPFKRSRYYRKYPWKRQNSREAYNAENRYLCQPSREDVFRLLVALHEARQGNRGRTVNFCNRKRPASAVFTNIRFLGKRK